MASKLDMIALANRKRGHRLRVLAARHIVDCVNPGLHSGNLARFSQLKDDAYTLVERNQANTELMSKMNRIARTHGFTDSFRLVTDGRAGFTSTSVPKRIKYLEKLEEKNLKFGKILLCVNSEVNTWTKTPLRQDKERQKRKGKGVFKVPHEILAKYSDIDIPRDPNILKKLLRPKIWMDLEVKGVRPLGSITIQLFTEAAPQIVMEFVRLCNLEQPKRLRFVRLFPSLWVESEMKLGKDSLVSKNIEFDKRVVDHGANTAVLSFSLEDMKMRKEGYMNFTVSFKPLRVLNGHRVGFGRVVSGLKTLNCIQDYGTKNGKPTKEIVVSKCGLFK